VLVANGIKDDARIRNAVAVAHRRGVAIDWTERRELDHLTGGVNHQGIALVAGSYPYVPLDAILESDGTVLVLDHLQDPQNLGTLIRSAEAAGIAGIVLPKDRAVEITPAVVNASAGAVEHVLVTQQPNLVRAIGSAKESDRWVLALDTGDDAVDLFTTDLPLPAALVVGAEASGVSPIVRRASDLIISIPMAGRVDSLNAATAGSIALFELVRRQRLSHAPA
jgi:23S rRNA (guanosine2251-2'-O)-methyltransferase